MTTRTRAAWFAATWLAALVALATPLVPAAWRPRPLLLGVPPAFAWSVLWLGVVFFAVLWLYRADEGPRSRR
jgi:hypothetical protein